MVNSRFPGRTHFGAYVLGAYGLGFHEIFTISLALKADSLGLSLQQFGILVGVGSVTPALAFVHFGRLMARIGDRRAFLTTTAAAGGLALCFAASNNYLTLVMLQLAMGAARTQAWVASQSYVTDIGRVQDRTTHTGRFGLFVGVGQMIGASVTGIVTQTHGADSGFWFGAVYSLIFLLHALLLPEAPRGRSSLEQIRLRDAMRLLTNRSVRAAILLTFTRLVLVTSYSAFIPLLLVNGGLAPGMVGFVVAVKAGVSTVLALTVGPLSRLMGVFRLGVAALGCGTLGLLLAPVLHGPVTSFGPAVLVGIAIGLSLPVILSTIADGAPKDLIGLSLSMREAVNQVAAAVSPPVIARLVGVIGLAGGFAVAAAACVGLLAIASTQMSARRRPE